MKVKWEWVAVVALVIAMLGQGTYFSYRMEKQQEKMSRSLEAVTDKTAAALTVVGAVVEKIGAFGEKSTVVRTGPTTINVTTDRPAATPKPEATPKPGSIDTTRPGPGSPQQPDGAKPGQPAAPPRAIVPADKREDARARASATIRLEFDAGSLNCPGNPEGPDVLELYIFPDSLGTTAPCVKRMVASFRTLAEPPKRAKQASKMFAMAGFPLSAGVGYTVTTVGVPLLGRFNVDALGFQSIGSRSDTFFGAGVSRDISCCTLVGAGAGQSLRGGSMVLGYFGTRW
jgi:hypothetical protein